MIITAVLLFWWHGFRKDSLKRLKYAASNFGECVYKWNSYNTHSSGIIIDYLLNFLI